jgi:predicted small metal-binding protein
MSVKDINDELVRQIADELRERHGLDEERSRENHKFAERFTDEHRETFDRLSQ